MDEFEEGVCDWFGSNGQSFGYILRDTGGSIYVHYKKITGTNLRDSNFKEMRKGDRVRFKEGVGHHNTGSQAIEVEIISFGTNS